MLTITQSKQLILDLQKFSFYWLRWTLWHYFDTQVTTFIHPNSQQVSWCLTKAPKNLIVQKEWLIVTLATAPIQSLYSLCCFNFAELLGTILSASITHLNFQYCNSATKTKTPLTYYNSTGYTLWLFGCSLIHATMTHCNHRRRNQGDTGGMCPPPPHPKFS